MNVADYFSIFVNDRKVAEVMFVNESSGFMQWIVWGYRFWLLIHNVFNEFWHKISCAHHMALYLVTSIKYINSPTTLSKAPVCGVVFSGGIGYGF
jgi:hypothetical protein